MLAALIYGLVLLFAGLWFSVHPESLYCPQCGYSLSYPTSLPIVCPYCHDFNLQVKW